MGYAGIREEELKNKIARDFFGQFDCTKILKDIDFAVRDSSVSDESAGYLLWAEAKAAPADIVVMLSQLVLTIGKTGVTRNTNPPHFLGCFDREKIAFIPYTVIQGILYQTDFNWNAAPSNHATPEFRKIAELIGTFIHSEAAGQTCVFHFGRDDGECEKFIRENFITAKADVTKIRIDKNNFITIYNKWLEAVQPTIEIDWDEARGIVDGDFYLADLLSAENKTLKEKLSILLRTNQYEWNVAVPRVRMSLFTRIMFKDGQKAHSLFWAKYERPPLEEYWDYIIARRDLLVPQDIRERKGSFFTPGIWVELSQKYLAEYLGENWQDEYYIWDCAAGTGNLLAGLTNPKNVWASTIDKADVDVMHERIRNGAKLFENQVFQFDFLNDDFSDLPAGLRSIVGDGAKRKKLLIYINPPYAEADNRRGEGRSGVAVSRIQSKYSDEMGYAKRELYIQFLTRIYCELPSCILGCFSKLKGIQAPKFKKFRQFFQAKLERMFLVPADTFDNVAGSFPIGFHIWNTAVEKAVPEITADVYDKSAEFLKTKTILSYDDDELINDWALTFWDEGGESIGTMIGVGNDFQNQRTVRIEKPHRQWNHQYQWQITKRNLLKSSVYLAVRTVVPADWTNDRDQFLYPGDSWGKDAGFQSDCLAYALFCASNHIRSEDGVNHWIPFTEEDVGLRRSFESHFMTEFMSGKIDCADGRNLFSGKKRANEKQKPLKFSSSAKAVFKAGRVLWRYYHAQPNADADASHYDIREYFQGRGDGGAMKNKSSDEEYETLNRNLRSALALLAREIEPKIYEYGFLK